jgi:GTP-binding protein HflX
VSARLLRQARNLESATGAQALDRTGVIMEIFHRHAHSREAKLQVEIARLKYVSRVCGNRRAADGNRGPGRARPISKLIAARSAIASRN